jgi:integrase/recombinase XerC
MSDNTVIVAGNHSDMADRFIDWLKTYADLEESTLRNYRSDLRDFITWWECGEGGGIPFEPAAVATPTLTQYRAHLQTIQKKAPTTINRHLVSLKRFFTWCADQGQISRDPAKAVRSVPSQRSAPRQLSDKEEARLVATVDQYGTLRDRALIYLLLHTGLRSCEACHLKLTDLEINPRSGWLIVRSGKRGKQRRVPLNITIRKALEVYLNELAINSEKTAPGQFVFRSEKGGGLTERGLRYVVAKYVQIARLEDVSPHDLRHRFGYRLAKTGTPLQEIAQLMGHDSTDTTLLYTKATGADLEARVEKLAWE